MQLVTPIWSDGVSVIPATILSFGNTIRGMLDLRARFGGMLVARLGRKGTGARILSSRSASPACSGTTPRAEPIRVLQPLIGNVNAVQAVLHVASTVSFGAEDL